MKTIGVDVGGTFTDLIAFDPQTGQLDIAKVPTTPEDQSRGFMSGLAELTASLDGVEAIVHGTTIGTNAILERKGVVLRPHHHPWLSRHPGARSTYPAQRLGTDRQFRSVDPA